MRKSSLFAILLLSSLSSFGWTYPEDGIQEFLFESGLGTEESPYIINTAQQLANLSWSVNCGDGYRGKYFKLGNDIDLGPDHREWIPIGLYNVFYGNFDGDGHTISNLYIHEPIYVSDTYMDYIYAGLFGNISGNKISNLNLTDVSINISIDGTDDTRSCDIHVGSVVAVSGSGDNILCDISAQGDISVSASTGQIKVGGIIGWGQSLNAIYGLSFKGSISASSDRPFAIDNTVGGIGGTISANDIHGLANEANIVISGKSFAVGGIAGDLANWDYLQVSDLVNRGNIDAGSSRASGIATITYFGGLENAHNYGTLSHDEGSGYCWGITDDARFSFMKKCSNNSSVQGHGLIGYGDYLSLVEDCSNNADVSGAAIMAESGPVDKIVFRRCTNIGAASYGILGSSQFDVEMEDCHNSGDITGNSGLFGNSYNFQTKITMRDCSNTGNIYGQNVQYVNYAMPTPHYLSYVGGLVAYATSVDMENCYNEGNVSGCLVVGGLVGYTQYLDMSDCYNKGDVELVSNEFLNDKLLAPSIVSGGLVGGSVDGKINNSSNYGNISHSEDQYTNVPDNERLSGGISGIIYYPYVNSVANHGKVAALGNTSAAGLIGKVSGDPYGSGSQNGYKISGSYNIGSISSVNATAAGLCAFTEGVTIEDCYSAGDISGVNAVGLTGEMSSTILNSCFSYSTLSGTKLAGIGNTKWDSNVANCVFWLIKDGEPTADYSATPIEGTIKGYTAEEFASGLVCIALNNGRTDDAPWGQIPDEDPYPLLNGGGDPEIDSIDGIAANADGYRVMDLQGRVYGDFESGTFNRLPEGIYIFTDKNGRTVKIYIK